MSQLSWASGYRLDGGPEKNPENSRCLLDSRADPDLDLVSAATSAWKKHHGVRDGG